MCAPIARAIDGAGGEVRTGAQWLVVDLHAWAWVDNPAGGFATFNSDILCPPHEE